MAMRINVYVAGVWWLLSIGVFCASFWFPFNWHRLFPEDGWFNIGVGYMFIFWCLTGIGILKGFYWGERLYKKKV